MEKDIIRQGIEHDTDISDMMEMEDEAGMPETFDITGYFAEQFDIGKIEARTYSPLALAFIGDGVYDLIIRTIVVGRGNCQANKLHKKTSRLVRASAQSAMIEELKPFLTEEEKTIYKRGRNAKSATMAKNASMSDYRRATGFEALIGYLYLKKEFKRIFDLVKIGLEKIEENED